MSIDKDQSPNALLLDFAKNGANWPAYDMCIVLEKIAALLPEALLLKALERGSELERGCDRSNVVDILAAYLPAHLMPKALDIMGGVRYRAETLIELAIYVPDHLLPQVLALAYETQDKVERVKALTGLIHYSPDILPEVVAVGRQISCVVHRIYALIDLVPYLPDLVPEILLAIRDCEITPIDHREYIQAGFLVTLTPYLQDHLPDSLLPEAAKIAQVIVDKKYRLQTLTTLVTRLPDLKSEVLALARGTEDEYERVLELAKLAVSLPDIGMEVLEVSNSIPDDLTRLRAIKNSLQYLPEHCLSDVIKMTRELSSPAHQALLLLGLINEAPQNLLSEICEIVNEIEDENRRNRMLKRLAERMSQSAPKISNGKI
jgi:hypothetical protein